MRLKNKKIIFLNILLIVFISAFIGIKMWNEPHKNVKDANAISVEATELYNFFVRDSAGAKKLYENKVLIISGIVKQVSKNQGNQNIIFLKTDNNNGSINCTMEEKINNNLQQGKQVILKGICSGYISGDVEMGLSGDVYLTRCYLSN